MKTATKDWLVMAVSITVIIGTFYAFVIINGRLTKNELRAEMQQIISHYRLTPSTESDISALETQRKSYDSSKMLYAESEPGKYYTISQEQLHGLLHQTFSKAEIYLSSTNYVLINRDWFWQCYSPALQNNIHKNFVWKTKFNCDNFAAYAKLNTEFIHSISIGSNAAKASIGEFHFLEYTQGHAVNILITAEGGKYGYELYEPQTGGLKKITPETEKEVYFIRF